MAVPVGRQTTAVIVRVHDHQNAALEEQSQGQSLLSTIDLLLLHVSTWPFCFGRRRLGAYGAMVGYCGAKQSYV